MELAHMAYKYENQPKICYECLMDSYDITKEEMEEADEKGVYICELCKERLLDG